MSQDILFLLKHDFTDGPDAPYYCPECAQLNGVLHYYPKLRHWLEVRYVDFPCPRPDVIALIGEANQSCPVLVLAGHAPASVQGVKAGEHNGRQFISGATEIGNYLSQIHNLGRPH